MRSALNKICLRHSIVLIGFCKQAPYLVHIFLRLRTVPVIGIAIVTKLLGLV